MEHSKQDSCFVANGRTYICNVMPFRMKNALATFQCLMGWVTHRLDSCIVYLDDVVLITDTWGYRFRVLKYFLAPCSEANSLDYLSKSEFVHASVSWRNWQVNK